LNSFSNALIALIESNPDSKTLLANIRSQSQKFNSGIRYLEIVDEDPYVDLVDFARKVGTRVSEPTVISSANILAETITGPDGFVIYESHRSEPDFTNFGLFDESINIALDNAHGVSIYLPKYASGEVHNAYLTRSLFGNFTENTTWDNFLLSGLTSLSPTNPSGISDYPPIAPLSLPSEPIVYLPFVSR